MGNGTATDLTIPLTGVCQQVIKYMGIKNHIPYISSWYERSFPRLRNIITKASSAGMTVLELDTVLIVVHLLITMPSLWHSYLFSYVICTKGVPYKACGVYKNYIGLKGIVAEFSIFVIWQHHGRWQHRGLGGIC